MNKHSNTLKVTDIQLALIVVGAILWFISPTLVYATWITGVAISVVMMTSINEDIYKQNKMLPWKIKVAMEVTSFFLAFFWFISAPMAVYVERRQRE